MFCPVFTLVMSLPLVLTMSALYFLSYVRREGLGLLSRAVGYFTVAFGILLFIGGLFTAVFSKNNGFCHKHGCYRHCEQPYRIKTHSCCSERKNRISERYHYNIKGDTLKGDKTIVQKETEQLRK